MTTPTRWQNPYTGRVSPFFILHDLVLLAALVFTITILIRTRTLKP